jgi:8-oxo-dGTP pyrophosphatase MutT (NUDIX family)
MSDWKTRLLAAVSPFEKGVQPLQVSGIRRPEEPDYRPGRTAAVLVPIIDQNEPELVLTLRARDLAHHPGQVSFPGGAVEGVDGSAVETAMRETREEIGVAESFIRPVGFLDRFDTVSDYRILPVVGLLQPGLEWVPDPTEVDEVFTVPFSYITDPSRFRRSEREYHGTTYTIWSLTWEGHVIWGVTAAIIRNLVDRMGAA